MIDVAAVLFLSSFSSAQGPISPTPVISFAMKTSLNKYGMLITEDVSGVWAFRNAWSLTDAKTGEIGRSCIAWSAKVRASSKWESILYTNDRLGKDGPTTISR